MKTSLVSLVAFSGLIASALTKHLLPRGRNSVCGSIFNSVAKCCSLSVIKIADLDCGDPERTPKDKDDLWTSAPRERVHSVVLFQYLVFWDCSAMTLTKSSSI